MDQKYSSVIYVTYRMNLILNIFFDGIKDIFGEKLTTSKSHGKFLKLTQNEDFSKNQGSGKMKNILRETGDQGKKVKN